MKKSISIVIALMLLINVFAVSAFAAVPSGNAIALTLTSDKDSYAAGDTVNVTLSIETTSAVAGLSAGEIEFGYNDAIFEPAADISGSPALLTYGCTYGDIIATNLDAAGSFVKAGAGEFYAEDVTAYGWNAGLHIGVAENFEGINYVDCSAGAKTFVTFPLKIKAGVADGTYTIGVNKYAFEDGGTGYLVDGALGGIYGAQGGDFGVAETDTFACGTVTITVGAGGSTEPEQPTVKVNNLSTQVQWANKEAGLMNVGFRGQIAEGYDASADKAGTTGPNGGDNLAKLTEVGFYLNGTKYQAYTIYNFVDGGYFYRVVVGNVSYDSEATFSAQAYVMIDGQEYKADASFETTGKAQYERAITVGMEAK